MRYFPREFSGLASFSFFAVVAGAGVGPSNSELSDIYFVLKENHGAILSFEMA